MVMTHILNDQGMLHISYYATDNHREGVVTVALQDPDGCHLSDDDTVENVLALENAAPGSEVTVLLHHADGTTEELSGIHV